MVNAPVPADRPTGFRWNVFLLACGTSWVLYLHRYTFALIKPFLREEYGLSNTQLGFFDSLFKMCYTGFQVPSGIIADVVGSHLFLSAAICVWTLALAGHALAPGLKSLAVAVAMLATGQSGCFAALSRLTKNWFPVEYRTVVQGFVGVFFGRAGGASANLLVLTILIGIFAFPWRTAVLVLVALGAAQAVLVLLLLRDRPQQHPWVNDAEADLISGKRTQQAGGNLVDQPADGSTPSRSSPKLSWREIYRGTSTRSVFNLGALNTQSILSTAADSIYSLWIPSFLSQVHQLDFKEMGIYSALPLIGGALGGGLGGFLNDVVIRKSASRRWGRTSVALVGKAMAGVLLATAIVMFYDQPRSFCLMLFLVKFFGDWSLTTTWGVITDIGGQTSASVFAFNNTVAGIGSLFFPPLFGLMADYSWKLVFVVVAGVYFACAASWLAINSTIPLYREDATKKDAAE